MILFFFFTEYVLQKSILYEMMESRNSGGSSNLAEGAANKPGVHAQYSQSKSRMGGLERILVLA